MSTVYLEHRDAHHLPGAGSPEEVKVALKKAAEAILRCDALLFTAGAGMLGQQTSRSWASTLKNLGYPCSD